MILILHTIKLAMNKLQFTLESPIWIPFSIGSLITIMFDHFDRATCKLLNRPLKLSLVIIGRCKSNRSIGMFAEMTPLRNPLNPFAFCNHIAIFCKRFFQAIFFAIDILNGVLFFA